MVSKHTRTVERFDTDTPGCAPSEDSSDEDIDEVNFCYEDTDKGVEDEPSFLAGSAPVADDSQDYDVGNIVLDVKGLCVKFKCKAVLELLVRRPPPAYITWSHVADGTFNGGGRRLVNAGASREEPGDAELPHASGHIGVEQHVAGLQVAMDNRRVALNTTEYKIKTLRTDRGGEFLSTEFTRFCENEGIERHLTAPYTPQQNDVVERRNRTVMAMARSLLKGTHMPARFWGEAVRHAVYLLNRLPTKALGDRTPFEAWMGRKPYLAHLRVFGCVAYVKNTTPHLKKLDDRSANHEENLPEFMVEDVLDTDEVIVVADIEAGTEDVTTSPAASSPSTLSSNTRTTSSPSKTNSPESYEGPVHFRSIADIYANTEEVVGIDEEEGEVMLISEEPTCYQEAATEACCTEKINKFKQQMITEFEMSDLGLLSYYLGIEVEQQKSRISLRQSAYAKKILSQFKMADCNATKHPMEPKTQLHKDLEGTPVDATEYRRIVGCLRYLLHTRPDLSYSIGMASRYMERPTIMHHRVVKQILRYLKGTIYFGLVYIKGPQEIGIFGYSDSDLAGDLDGRKSTSGMTFYFNESLVSWNSQKQKTVTLSSCEAEFMAATTAACHALWLRSLASELTGVKPKPVTLFVDNKSAIALMKNPVFHGRSKHIDTRFHFIRECIEKGQIVVEFVNTGEQRADALTKALPGVKLAAMRQLLGVRDLQSFLQAPVRHKLKQNGCEFVAHGVDADAGGEDLDEVRMADFAQRFALREEGLEGAAVLEVKHLDRDLLIAEEVSVHRAIPSDAKFSGEKSSVVSVWFTTFLYLRKKKTL
ncbi:hypothetical protein ZIOFF_000205 [Zingiber officinale]|uniref:Integrase catalytic domain-containing protein n=1 Tax=Zingiber officinale TaxID=94328 RepID=A0A8J5I7W7_ZINOF|nr:hypothetical protein ZIOFF_000205 [Zingiber officinale]